MPYLVSCMWYYVLLWFIVKSILLYVVIVLYFVLSLLSVMPYLVYAVQVYVISFMRFFFYEIFFNRCCDLALPVTLPCVVE